MYKMLIADDEVHVRDYMKTVLPWEDMGIEICGCAQKGEEALEIAKHELPDFALMDINMPGMNGLDLTEALLEIRSDLIVAFVTGYSEFEYARRALQLGANEYILKPFTPDELKAAISRLIMKKKKQERESHKSEAEQKVLNENLLLEFIKRNVDYGGIDYETRLKDAEISFSFPCFIVSIIEINYTDTISEKDNELWKFAIRNVMEEYPIPKETNEFVLYGVDRKIIVLLNGERKSITEELMTYLDKVMKLIMDYMNIQITIGVGEIVDDIDIVSESYQQACEACQERYRLGSGKIYRFSAMLKNGLITPKGTELTTKRTEEIIKSVEQYISQNYRDETLTVEKIAEGVYLDASYIRKIFSKYLGFTINDYLTVVRLTEASRLLEQGKLSIGEVAGKTGYADQGYFTKCFRKRYGVSPRDFIENRLRK